MAIGADMQISQIYSNQDNVFSPIIFNSGVDAATINVVFAKVTRPKSRDGDSHNLGKTTLIHLIDFLLLKNIAGGLHFLEMHADRFRDFVFFIEIALQGGRYITVRRSVAEQTKIAFKTHGEKYLDCRTVDDSGWDHWAVALDRAREILDSYLDLRAISPWGFRKGVSYFLRTQEDYRDYFQIQKFVQGKDREWKPYLARMLGLNFEAVAEKYKLDDTIEELTRLREIKKSEIALANQDRGELVTRVEIMRDEIEQIDAQLDSFDFQQEERRISKHVVQKVESEISAINTELYDLDSDIAQLERSISRGIKFDLDRIKSIFEESSVAFPDAIARSYDDLVDFNRRLTRERNAAIKGQIRNLTQQKDVLLVRHQELNDERQRLLEVIREADTFRKYKALQKEQAAKHADLSYIESQLGRVDEVEALDRELREQRRIRDELITAIEIGLQRGSATKTNVTQLFNRYVKQVLNINGVFSVSKNKLGNLEFEIKTTDAFGTATSQDKGHSYHMLLCALFDLAVLKALENFPFYHFVYHDGIFEGLDNRVKLRLLETIRSVIASGKIQYILSIIDSDLPRDANDKPIHFSDDEVVLTLHDQGNQGRLFRMASF